MDESVANTIKEQLSERVITPLFTNNNVVLPPGKNAYDVIDALVPGDNVQLLAAMYHDLCWLGIEIVHRHDRRELERLAFERGVNVKFHYSWKGVSLEITHPQGGNNEKKPPSPPENEKKPPSPPSE